MILYLSKIINTHKKDELFRRIRIMNKMKKIFAVVLAAVMCLAVAGCDKKDSTDAAVTDSVVEQSVQTTATEDNANNNTTTSGTLVMATNASFPPYEYYENEKIVGIDAEVAELIAQKLGMTLEIKDMEFGSIIGAVQTGTVDMGMAGMTVTEDRLVTVDFSDTYATAVQVIIVKEDSEIKSADDLEGKKIGVQENTTGDIYVTADFGEESVKRYSKGNDAVAALSAGIVDAVIIDNEPAKNYVAANEGLKVLDTSYADEEYAIAVSKDNTELKEKINAALAELKEDGTLDSIVEKYIPED